MAGPSDRTNTPRDGTLEEPDSLPGSPIVSAHNKPFEICLGGFPRRFESPQEGGQAGNHVFLLRTACIWLICGIDWIRSRVQAEAEGWERKKWERWKQGLKDTKDVDSEDETKALVEEALSTMEKAEHGREVQALIGTPEPRPDRISRIVHAASCILHGRMNDIVPLGSI